MRAWLHGLSERVISSAGGEQELLNRKLLIFACGMMNAGVMLWLALYWAMGIRFSATVPLAYIVVSTASLGLYIWNLNFAQFRFVQVSLFLFVPFIMQWSIGSYVTSSGVMLWALLAPVGVIVFQSPRDALPWFVAYVVMTGISGFFDYYVGQSAASGVPMQGIAVFFALNFAAISTIVYLLLSYFVRQRDRLAEVLDEQHELLKQEQRKSESLLLNILPGPIAQRLKDQHDTIADGFADVTVMFADIVDFTRLSVEMPPESMVALLNKIFSHFDLLAEKYGLEKIKTIGDAYMVAGGLDPRHVEAAPDEGNRGYSDSVAGMALEMRDYMETLSGLTKSPLRIHVGIGTGPVVAGVIGIKKFIYDLWGDTVNLANRITGEAAMGEILCDVATYERLKPLYDFDGPVTHQVKGRTSVPVYRVIGRKADAPHRRAALSADSREAASGV